MAPHPSPDVIARTVHPGGVLVHLGQNMIYEVNATGMEIWRLFSDGLSREAMIDRLTAAFEIDEEHASAEIERLLADLQSLGLIEP